MQPESHLSLHSPKGHSYVSVSAARKRKADSVDELESASRFNSAVSIDKDSRVELSREDVHFQRQIRTFDQDASIVFVGPRGNGKSSLAVIAATALRREVVDAHEYFLKATGITQAAF